MYISKVGLKFSFLLSSHTGSLALFRLPGMFFPDMVPLDIETSTRMFRPHRVPS